MEVKEIRAYLNKQENAMTKTYLVNMCVGLSIFLLFGSIFKFAAAAEQSEPLSPETISELPVNQSEPVLSERSANRILALANNMSEKMRAAINRHVHITNRLEQRLNVMEQEGFVISSSTTAFLTQAETDINQARVIIDDELDALVDYTVFSDAPAQNWMQTRARFSDSASLIREAFVSLENALTELEDTRN